MKGDAVAERPKGRVLIADDNAFFLKTLSRILTATGFEVYQAKDGNEALALAHEHIPDLMMLDIDMPRLDGITACKKLKSTPDTAHIPVIFITAMSTSQVRLEAVRAGGAQFISTPSATAPAIRSIAGRMTYIELSVDNSFYEAFTSALFLPHTDLSLFPSVRVDQVNLPSLPTPRSHA